MIMCVPFLANSAITLTFEQEGSDVWIKAYGAITSDFGPKNRSSYGAIVSGVTAGYTSLASAWWAEGVHFAYGDGGSGFDYYYLTNDFVKSIEETNFVGNTPSNNTGILQAYPNPNYLNITASFTGSTVYYGRNMFYGGLKVEITKDQTFINSEAKYLNTSLSAFFSDQFIGKTYNLVKQSDPQINLLTLNIVPEPSALSLLAIGLGGLAMMRRRRS